MSDPTETDTLLPEPPAPIPIETKVTEATALIKSRVLWAMGAGLVPLPFLDLAAIAGVQLKLLDELSKLYGVKFAEHRAKNIIGALAGSFGTGTIATGAVASLIKIIPIVGQVGSAVALPIVAGASTYAVGKVFVQHFESGGTFLDFDPVKTKEYFAKYYAEGQQVATDIKAASK